MDREHVAEVVLPRRVQKQPTPDLNNGGDCGPCVLGGIVGATPQEIYERHYEGKPRSISRDEMQRLLRVEHSAGRLDRFIEHAARWEMGRYYQKSWGDPAYKQVHGWFPYVQAMIDAGFYGLAEVDHSRTGGDARGGPDHWVLICGARSWTQWRENETPELGKWRSGSYVMEVLVSCSARSTPDEEWVDARAFLKDRGGYDLLFARPKT